MIEISKTIVHTAGPECRKAVLALSREISRRTRLEFSVTEHQNPDFAIDGAEALAIEALLPEAEQDDALAGCNVLNEEPEEETHTGGRVTGHYLRTLRAVAGNAAAAQAVLQKLDPNPGTVAKGRRKRSARTSRRNT